MSRASVTEPDRARDSRCSSCGSPIVWVPGHDGPLDPPEIWIVVRLSFLVAADDVRGVTRTGIVVRGQPCAVGEGCGDHPDAAPVRISHFATCPNAAAHRKRGRRARA